MKRTKIKEKETGNCTFLNLTVKRNDLLIKTKVDKQPRGFICAFHATVDGSNPKHAVYSVL